MVKDKKKVTDIDTSKNSYTETVLNQKSDTELDYLFIYLITDRDLSLEADNTYPSTRIFTNFYTTKIYIVHSLRHKKT